MKKIVCIICGIALFAIIIFTVFGQRGLVHLNRLRSELHRYQQENHILTEKNRKLAQEIELLRNNLEYIEETARSQLGMAYPDEIIYQVIPPQSSQPPDPG